MSLDIEVKREQLSVYTILFLVTFVFLLNSPQHPLRESAMFTDSGVFQTIALAICDGLLPYRDSFDHKGPILYIINLAGVLIGTKHGIWYIELLTLFAFAVFVYKISRLVSGSLFVNLFAVALSFCLLDNFYEGGNFTEEYAMPLIAYSLYVFLDFLINRNVTRWRIFACGLCFASVLLLRPNMIAVWIVFCPYIAALLLYRENWNKFLRFTILFLLGVLFLILPFMVGMFSLGIFESFIDSYILFNLSYTKTDATTLFFSVLFFGTNLIFVFSVLGSLYLVRDDKKNRSIFFVYFCYLVLSLLLVALPGRFYGHYGMVLVPAIAFPVTSIVVYLLKINNSNVLIKFVSLSILFVGLGHWSSIMLRGQDKLDEDILNMITIIQNVTGPNDRISVYGNWDALYVLSQRKHATKYSYQFPIGQVRPEILTDYIEALRVEKPPVVVIQLGRNKDLLINKFLSDYNYKPIYSNGHQIFVKERTDK